jgi:hypothetical protein
VNERMSTQKAAARFVGGQFFVLFMIEINPPPGRLLALHPETR